MVIVAQLCKFKILQSLNFTLKQLNIMVYKAYLSELLKKEEGSQKKEGLPSDAKHDLNKWKHCLIKDEYKKI